MPATAIYALLDPATQEVRYIGKTVKPLYWRLQQHIYDARVCRRNGHKVEWIRKLLAGGAEPIIQLLEVVPADGDWIAAERRWIAHGRSQGWRLTNSTDGGEGTTGYVMPIELTARFSEQRRGVGNVRAQLTEDDVLVIREWYSRGGISQRELAIEYSVTETNIRAIIRGKTWIHIGGKTLAPRQIDPRVKLTSSQVVEIRSAYSSGQFTLKQIADQYGVKTACVQSAVTGNSWRDAGGAVTAVREGVAGENNPRAKLTEQQVIEILDRHAAGEKNAHLARAYGVSKCLVGLIVKGKAWPHVKRK